MSLLLDARPELPQGGSATAVRRAPLGEDVRRAVTALLRERARRLLRALAARPAAAAAFLPVLLHASFEAPLLDGEAPGVASLRYRRRWASLARGFGLPPPCRAQRGRCLVEAVLGVPTPAGLDALVLVPSGLSVEELGRLQERLEGAQQVFAAAGAPVRAVLFDPARLAQDHEVAQRALAYGALLGGQLTGGWWAVIEGTRRPLAPLTTSALAAHAASPLATLAFTLMSRAPCPGPLDAAVALLAGGASPRHLSDPAVFCVRWAGLVPGLASLLEEAIALTAGAEVPGPAGELSRLLEHGRALALACARAIRSSRLGHVDRFTQRLWREALGPGLPRLLLPALGAHLGQLAAAGQLRLDPARAATGYEVRLPGGALLGRGASPVQARVRALALVAAADAARARPGQPPPASLHAGLEAAWREVAQRLARPRDHSALLLVPVAGGSARPGPPLDLLNRGPTRTLEFDGALSVLLAPGRRASGRMLAPDEAVRAVLMRAPGGAALELVAAHTAARPVAARLAQIAALLRDPSLPGPIAVEAGGRVLIAHGSGVKSYPLARFAARPRVFTPDPDAPDISICTGERQGGRLHAAGVVQCRVVLGGPGRAALLYADGDGGHLREEVGLAELEERLRDSRLVLRESQPPAVLAIRLSEGLDLALRRAGSPAPRMEAVVRGALPFVEVEIAGERFGGRARLGWRAAAEALLARSSAGSEGLVAVRSVQVTTGGRGAGPLLSLHAASVVRRRLRTHLQHVLTTYRTASAGRRKG